MHSGIVDLSLLVLRERTKLTKQHRSPNHENILGAERKINGRLVQKSFHFAMYSTL